MYNPYLPEEKFAPDHPPREACKRIRSATRMGYVSRKNPDGEWQAYVGRYGVGWINILPRWDTTSYVTVVYYIAD